MKNLERLMILTSLAACTPQPRPHFEIAVRVESDPGVPLTAAELRLAGKPLQHSTTDGALLVTLDGSAGDTVGLEVVCPEGYRAPTAPLRVLLRPLAEHDRRPEFHVSCPPLTRKLVVAVRAQQGPGLPVRYLGREIARTDSAGAAHAVLTATPGETLSLTLDTGATENTQLMPQHPELKVNVPDRDELVVFDQTFTRPVVVVKVKHKPRPPEQGPKRI